MTDEEYEWRTHLEQAGYDGGRIHGPDGRFTENPRRPAPPPSRANWSAFLIALVAVPGTFALIYVVMYTVFYLFCKATGRL